MCTRDRVSHHESGTTGGIVRWFTASSLCVFQRNLDHPKPDGRGINISGVDFWHAVEFSRNGRFLRTHPLGLSSGRFPSVFPTLSDLFLDLIPSQRGLSSRPLGRSDVSNLSGSLRFPQIGAVKSNFGHAKIVPLGGRAEGWVPQLRRKVLSQNRYGPVATRRTLRIRMATVNCPRPSSSRSFSPGR